MRQEDIFRSNNWISATSDGAYVSLNTGKICELGENASQGIEYVQNEKKRYTIEPNHNGKVIKLAEDLSSLLMEHQKVGVKFIWDALIERNTGAILADEMGMGKTLTALSFIDTYVHYYPNTNVLILLPKSIIQSWEDDISKIAKRTYKFRYYKSYPKGAEKPTLKNNCAYLMTYEVFSKFKDIYDVRKQLHLFTRTLNINDFFCCCCSLIVAKDPYPRRRASSEEPGLKTRKICE